MEEAIKPLRSLQPPGRLDSSTGFPQIQATSFLSHILSHSVITIGGYLRLASFPLHLFIHFLLHSFSSSSFRSQVTLSFNHLMTSISLLAIFLEMCYFPNQPAKNQAPDFSSQKIRPFPCKACTTRPWTLTPLTMFYTSPCACLTAATLLATPCDQLNCALPECLLKSQPQVPINTNYFGNRAFAVIIK